LASLTAAARNNACFAGALYARADAAGMTISNDAASAMVEALADVDAGGTATANDDDDDASSSPLLQLYENVLSRGHALSLRAHRQAVSRFVAGGCWRGVARALEAAPAGAGGVAAALSAENVRSLQAHLVHRGAWARVARATATLGAAAQGACEEPLTAALAARPQDSCIAEFDALAADGKMSDATACTWVRAAAACGHAQLALHAYGTHKAALLSDGGALAALAAALARAPATHAPDAAALLAAAHKRGVLPEPRAASALLRCLGGGGADHAAAALSLLPLLPQPPCDDDTLSLMHALTTMCEQQQASLPPPAAAVALFQELCDGGGWAAELREGRLAVCLASLPRGACDSARFAALLLPPPPLRASCLEDISLRLDAAREGAAAAGAAQAAQLWGDAADAALEASLMAPHADAQALSRLTAAVQAAAAASHAGADGPTKVAAAAAAAAAPGAGHEAAPPPLLRFSAAALKQMDEGAMRDLATALRVRDARKLPKKALREALLKLASSA
jgi:hypothetical protein